MLDAQMMARSTNFAWGRPGGVYRWGNTYILASKFFTKNFFNRIPLKRILPNPRACSESVWQTSLLRTHSQNETLLRDFPKSTSAATKVDSGSRAHVCMSSRHAHPGSRVVCVEMEPLEEMEEMEVLPFSLRGVGVSIWFLYISIPHA